MQNIGQAILKSVINVDVDSKTFQITSLFNVIIKLTVSKITMNTVVSRNNTGNIKW